MSSPYRHLTVILPYVELRADLKPVMTQQSQSIGTRNLYTSSPTVSASHFGLLYCDRSLIYTESYALQVKWELECIRNLLLRSEMLPLQKRTGKLTVPSTWPRFPVLACPPK
jgi:hypothetical protein